MWDGVPLNFVAEPAPIKGMHGRTSPVSAAASLRRMMADLKMFVIAPGPAERAGSTEQASEIERGAKLARSLGKVQVGMPDRRTHPSGMRRGV